MRDDRGITGGARDFDRFERLGKRADLVDLDQDRIADAFRDAAREPLWIRDEEIIALPTLAAGVAGTQRCPPAQTQGARSSKSLL